MITDRIWLHSVPLPLLIKYMASSTSRQDETKSRAMLGYPSGQDGAFWRSFCRCFLCHTINPLLTKLVQSRWLNIGLVILLRFHGPRRSLGFPVSISLSRRGKMRGWRDLCRLPTRFLSRMRLRFLEQQVTFFSLETQPTEPVCGRNFSWNAGVLQTIKVRSFNQSINVAFQLFNLDLLTFAAFLIQSCWAT